MTPTTDWTEEFDKKFIGNCDPQWMPKVHGFLVQDREEIKSFIRDLLAKQREEIAKMGERLKAEAEKNPLPGTHLKNEIRYNTGYGDALTDFVTLINNSK